MPSSVVDAVFSQHIEPTGSGRGQPLGRAIRKQSAPRRHFPASITEITAKISVEKAVRALGTIEMCKKRQDQLNAQLTQLEWPTARFASLGNQDPVRDPDEAAVYEEERARLAAIRHAAEDELERLFGAEVGPPLNLQAAVQQRKAASAAEALHAQMADMAMGDAPESPASSFASTGNPRFQRDQLAQQNRSDSPPPAYRSLGTND